MTRNGSPKSEANLRFAFLAHCEVLNVFCFCFSAFLSAFSSAVPSISSAVPSTLAIFYSFSSGLSPSSRLSPSVSSAFSLCVCLLLFLLLCFFSAFSFAFLFLFSTLSSTFVSFASLSAVFHSSSSAFLATSSSVFFFTFASFSCFSSAFFSACSSAFLSVSVAFSSMFVSFVSFFLAFVFTFFSESPSGSYAVFSVFASVSSFFSVLFSVFYFVFPLLSPHFALRSPPFLSSLLRSSPPPPPPPLRLRCCSSVPFLCVCRCLLICVSLRPCFLCVRILLSFSSLRSFPSSSLGSPRSQPSPLRSRLSLPSSLHSSLLSSTAFPPYHRPLPLRLHACLCLLFCVLLLCSSPPPALRVFGLRRLLVYVRLFLFCCLCSLLHILLCVSLGFLRFFINVRFLFCSLFCIFLRVILRFPWSSQTFSYVFASFSFFSSPFLFVSSGFSLRASPFLPFPLRSSPPSAFRFPRFPFYEAPCARSFTCYSNEPRDDRSTTVKLYCASCSIKHVTHM